MNRAIFYAVALCLGLFPLAASAAEQLVLLRNGSVIRGEVSHEVGRLVVASRGGQLRFDQRDVAAVGDSLLSLYEWRREQLAGAVSAQDHLDLADWAMRQSLWPQAARELLDARALVPDSPRLALLERRLNWMSAPKPDRTVVQATYEAETPAAEAKPQRPSEAVDHPGLTVRQSELELFSRRVQPILVNNCTNAGCHAVGGEQDFQLSRDLLYGHATAESTGRNLRGVLSAIDEEEPQASALLAALRGQHAGVMPLSGPRADEWRSLVADWVVAVARSNLPELPSEPADPVVDRIAQEGPTQLEEPRELDETLFAPKPLKRGAQLSHWEPRDEFDPEIFNRQHRRAEDDLPVE